MSLGKEPNSIHWIGSRVTGCSQKEKICSPPGKSVPDIHLIVYEEKLWLYEMQAGKYI
jgi:hypothetical protein